MKRLLLAFLLLFTPLLLLAGPLPANQAFQLNAKITPDHTIQLQWLIAPKHTLYRKRIHVSLLQPNTGEIGHLLRPLGQIKHESDGSEIRVYHNRATIAVPLLAVKDSAQLKVQYQGCSSEGFCYPPIIKQVAVNFKQNTVTVTAFHVPDNETQRISHLLAHKTFLLTLLSFLGFGLLLAFSPCVFPLLPILSGIIVGQGEHLTTRRAFLLSVSYVLGMSIAYALAGVLAAMAGSSLQIALQNRWVITGFAFLFVLLALSLFGLYELQLPKSLRGLAGRVSGQQRKSGVVGVAAMGALSILIASPCVTPPLIGALSYIAKTGNIVVGGSALFFLGLGMGIPLLAFGVLGGKYLPKAGRWMYVVKVFFGIVLLAMAGWLALRAWPLDSHKQTKFIYVNNLKAIQSQLHIAKKQHQPALLDFHADWCSSCKVLERDVFTAPEMQTALSAFRLLRVDMTHSSPAVKQMQHAYEVIGPPVVIFFDRQGYRHPESRITGEVSQMTFKQMLQGIH
ncbi:MAG: hypothetical protein DHS20C10_03040 [marine bacterium B5-7]|nr:MAG: hypothetical protein DHS20C10_03040 [marine bacterium B5-7]